jgi:hypothetical protein
LVIDNLRRRIAIHGHRAWTDRIYLAELLGYETAAEQIMAQIRLHGAPGPRRQPPAAYKEAAEKYLAEMESKGELEPDPSPADLRASAVEAQKSLDKCPFGSAKWTEETWASIDARLGADKTSIVKADAARKAARSWRVKLVDGKLAYENPAHEVIDPAGIHRARDV